MDPSKKRDLNLIASFRGLSAVGDQLALFALMVHFAHTSDKWMVGAVTFANAVMPVVLVPISGLIVDRVPNKQLLGCLGVAQALVVSALAFTHQPALILLCIALLGCGVAFTQPGYSALVASFIPEDEMAAAQSRLQTISQGAMLAGPILAGVIYGTLGHAAPFLIDAVTFFLVGVTTFALRNNRIPQRQPKESRRGEASAGLRFLMSDKLLAPVIIETFVFIFALDIISVVEVVLFTHTMHASALTYGLVGGVFGFGMVLGALATGKFPPGQINYVVYLFLGALTISAMFTAMGWLPSIGVVFPFMFVAGIANGVANVAANTLFALRIPADIRGRANAAVSSVFTSASLGSMAIGGVLVASMTPRMIFHIAGISSAAAILFFGPTTVRRARRAYGAERNLDQPANDIS